MIIVITGATGYIGNAVAKRLSKENDVWCAVRHTSDMHRIEHIRCRTFDVDPRECLYKRLVEIKPQLVIHLAGVFLSEHRSDNISEMLDSNIDFPTILFDAAYEAGCRQFINTGSCWQNYGGSKYNPVNLYAATKQATEDILEFYVNVKSVKAITLCIFDSYGPDDSRNKVLNIVNQLSDGDSIDMSGGEQKMYLCYIEDIASAYAQAINVLSNMKDGEYAKYAVRGEKTYSLKEIIDKYLILSKKKIVIRWGKRQYRKREIMDPSGWGTIMPGWHAEYSLEKGLRLYISNGGKNR